MDIGEPVPDFEATAHDGRQVRLSDYTAEGPVVLFFYPKASTRGCTLEARHFRDLASRFAEVGASRLGVSRDDVADQASFAVANHLDFPLLADTDGSIAAIFGAKRPGPAPSRRQTFVVGADQRLLAVVSSETDMELHADEALRVIAGSGGASAVTGAAGR